MNEAHIKSEGNQLLAKVKKAVVVSSSLENLRHPFSAALRGGKGGSVRVQARIIWGSLMT